MHQLCRSPSTGKPPTITGLTSAGERHLITLKGSSALGTESGLGVGAKVTPHLLDQTSAELDYLCGQIVLKPRPVRGGPK
jgi:hypothetical protein